MSYIQYDREETYFLIKEPIFCFISPKKLLVSAGSSNILLIEICNDNHNFEF